MRVNEAAAETNHPTAGSKTGSTTGPKAGAVGAIELPLLAAVACIGPVIGTIGWLLVPHARDAFNDFHAYWLAARLIAEGRSPYDLQALSALGHGLGLDWLVGSGYSYPLPFAIAMLPLSRLPFWTAVAVFSILSVVVFGSTVAGWVRFAHGPAHDAGAFRTRVVLALAAGFFPPVIGSVANGQANLLVLGAMTLGSALLLRRHAGAAGGVGGGIAFGLAAIVKLVPGLVLLPLALGRRRVAATALVATALVTLLGAALVSPAGSAGSGGLGILFEPDTYLTNQSINGFVSRLVLDGDQTRAILPGAFDPVVGSIVLTGIAALATLTVLVVARRGERGRDGLALAIAFAIVAGTLGAPKSSFWNESLVLVSVALMLAVANPGLDPRRFDPRRLPAVDALLLAAWLAGTALELLVPVLASDPSSVLPGTPGTLLASASLYGLVALWLLLAIRLLRLPASVPAAAPEND